MQALGDDYRSLIQETRESPVGFSKHPKQLKVWISRGINLNLKV